MNIYQQQILDHYKKPRNFGKLDKPDAGCELGNSFCGDKIHIEIKVTKLETGNLKLETIKFSGEGCAISMSSASMLTEKVKGMTIKDMKILRYEDIKKILGIELSPIRIKCAMLGLEVLQKAISLV